ncbi:hypothetical protein BDZ89DRAFT_1252542 [Hymenopellis radicata]|nr:hypothetical protein BDZ89DRAFT_1252542 [Hymenopellis radicata]
MSKLVPKIPIILVEESAPDGYKVINIAGPASLSGKNIRSFDAGFIRQRIQENSSLWRLCARRHLSVDETQQSKAIGTGDNDTGVRQPYTFSLVHSTSSSSSNIKLHRIYFVAYPKASPAPTVVKRKPALRSKIEGYADNPIYIVGDDKGKLDLSAPPSDFQRCLNPPPGRRYLVSDSTMNIPKFLEFCGDSTLGVYTPVPCDLDAASSASMLESQFLGTLGKLAVGPYAAAPLSYPPSKDFVMDFDFAEFAVDSLTSTTFEKSLNDYLYVCVADFIPKYDKHLHFGQAGEFLKSTNGNGQAALNKLLKHVERQLDEIGVSRVVMIIRGYDALRNLAEVKSLRTSESPTNPSEFPSPQRITDVFKVNLYHTVFRFLDETGTISRLFLFGTSPAFSAELRPSAYTDLTTMGVLGLLGLPPTKCKSTYRSSSEISHPLAWTPSPPQYPRRLCTKFFQFFMKHLLETTDRTIFWCLRTADRRRGDSHMFMAAKACAARPFLAYCVDVGYLTLSFDVPGAEPGVHFQYTFPGHSVYQIFLRDILSAADQSGLAVRTAFDGSPEWIFDVMDPYLVTSRSTMSNVNAPADTFQSIRTNLMHLAEAHSAGNTYNVVMEAELTTKHRAATVVPLYEKDETIIIEDNIIRIFDLLEGTMGTKLERYPKSHAIIESKLTAEHWKQAKALSKHLRELPGSVFTDAKLPPHGNIPEKPKHSSRTLEDNPPTQLEDFFFMGTHLRALVFCRTGRSAACR